MRSFFFDKAAQSVEELIADVKNYERYVRIQLDGITADGFGFVRVV